MLVVGKEGRLVVKSCLVMLVVGNEGRFVVKSCLVMSVVFTLDIASGLMRLVESCLAAGALKAKAVHEASSSNPVTLMC